MNFRNFVLILGATFGLAWLAIIILPYLQMRSIDPMVMEDAMGTDAVYIPKRAGRVAEGSKVYAENGCYLCHTQIIRPTYAGNDLFRPDWAGIVNDDGDSRRETNVFDFADEKFANIGLNRIGPDLSNFAVRVREIYAKDESAEAWVYKHLYNPRRTAELRNSICQPVRYLFSEEKVIGNRSNEALPFGEEGYEVIPGPDARALVSYLLSLKKDQAIPTGLNFAPAESKKPDAKPAS